MCFYMCVCTRVCAPLAAGLVCLSSAWLAVAAAVESSNNGTPSNSATSTMHTRGEGERQIRLNDSHGFGLKPEKTLSSIA